MLSTWISSLNLPSVLSTQPCERKKINLSSSHTEADSWRLMSLSHSHWPNESAAWIFYVVEKENPWNRNLMICCFIYFSWCLFSIPQYLIILYFHCVKFWKRLFLKICLVCLLVLLSVGVGVASPSPWLSGHLLVVSLVSPPLFPAPPLPISSFSLFASTNFTRLSRFCPPAFPSLACLVCAWVWSPVFVPVLILDSLCDNVKPFTICVVWSSLMLFPTMFQPREI